MENSLAVLPSTLETRGLAMPSLVSKVDPAAADPDAGWSGDKDVLQGRLVRWFEDAETSSRDARLSAERDRAYYDGHQWTEEELTALKARKQPATKINYIRRKVDFMLGFERRLRSDPKAFPRTPMEEAHADAATQALRFVADDSNFDRVRSSVYENILIEGFGGCDAVVEDDIDGQPTPRYLHVPWDRLFYDPHSRHPDFEDARYLGIVIWMDRDEALDLYPGSENVLEATFGGASTFGGTYDDKPAVLWCDNRRTRVRAIQIHWKDGGDWWKATLTKGGFLSDPEKSPYIDKRGRTCASLLMRSAYVDGKTGARYGVVRDWIEVQDEINKRRSKALHLLSVRQVVAEEGAVDDVDRARTELARPDGWIVRNPGLELRIEQTSDLATGQFHLLDHATKEMQASGPNNSMAGKDPRDLSGRAISLQQAGGAVELEPLTDGLRQWSRRCYEAGWMRVRQFWTDERWLRVTDDQRNQRWVGINRKVTLSDELAAMPEDQRAAAAQRLGLFPNDPRLSMVIRVENPIQDINIDIKLEEGPDTPTMQAEDFATLMQLVPTLAPGTIPAEVIIQASSLRNKDVLLDMLKKHEAAAAQQQQAEAPVKQAMVQAKLRDVNAGAAVKEATAAEKQADTMNTFHGMAMDHASTQSVPVMPAIAPPSPVAPPQLLPA